MLRRLSTLVSAASLVLCAATCVLWVRSYWVGEGWHYYRLVRAAAPTTVRHVEVYSGYGQFAVGLDTRTSTDPSDVFTPSDPRSHSESYIIPMATGSWSLHHLLAFGAGPLVRQDGTWAVQGWYCSFPAWVLCLVLLVLPSVYWVRRKRVRTSQGLCPT